jgi:hypothetical protein
MVIMVVSYGCYEVNEFIPEQFRKQIAHIRNFKKALILSAEYATL